MSSYILNEKGQAMPGGYHAITPDAFRSIPHTELRWLGNGGIMLNVRGTVIFIDPLLEGFDMPLLFEPPITPAQVPALAGLLITHIDNDHFSRPTCTDLLPVCKSYHATRFVAQEMKKIGVPGIGHDIGDSFSIGPVSFLLTPAKHNWQSEGAKYQYRVWAEEDYCGYWIDTPDGTIWLPGDSRLLESHLHMPNPDVILFDFSDNDWHITLDGAAKLANTYPDAKLICIHWGTVDAPGMSPFCGNPGEIQKRIVNPERLLVLDPGEPYSMV